MIDNSAATTPAHALSIAQAHLNNKNIPQALRTLNIAHNKHPSNTLLSKELARLCLKLGKIQDAIRVLENTVKKGNKDTGLIFMLASLLHMSRQYKKALFVAENLARLHPEFHQVYSLIGNTQYELGNLSEAESAYKKALELDADNANTYNNLAWLHRTQGDKTEAVNCFKQALELDPQATDALLGLTMLSPKDQDIERFISEAKKNALDDKQLAELHFAKAKHLDQKAQHDMAFEQYKHANKHWRSHKPYDLSKDQELFSMLKNAFGEEFKTNIMRNDYGMKDAAKITPIFIVGLPRSSTTLVEQILASHENVAAAGEINYLPDQILKSLKHFKNIDEQATSAAQRLAQEYLEQLSQHANNCTYVIDKLPQNFLFLGFIAKSMPHAKIIHCQRDPLDNAVSLFKHHFPMSMHGYAYSLQDISEYIKLYKEMMEYWSELHPNRWFNLDYEKLVENPKEQIANLLKHCGLEIDEKCYNFHLTKRPIRTASSEQVRETISDKSLQQWQVYQKHLEELISSLQSYS